MHIIAANFIADMPGPTFLVFYAAVIVTVYFVVWLVLRQRDSSHLLPPMAIPADPDPYEIAYLRGGENEVLRLIILELIQREYLKIEGDTIGIHPRPSNPRHLQEPHRTCFSQLAKGMKV